MDIEKYGLEMLGRKSLTDAYEIDAENIELTGTSKNLYGILYQYRVFSSSYYFDYNSVNIRVSNGEITGYGCSCREFAMRRSCKHIAAVLLNNSDDLFPKPLSIEEITENLLNEFDTTIEEKGIKEPIKLTVELDLEYTPSFRLYVGLKKQYVLNTENKLTTFINTYKNGGTYCLGKEFTFDSNKHYLKKEDEELIDVISSFTSDYNKRALDLTNSELKYLLDKLINREFKLKDYGIVNNISYSFPTEINLDIKEDKYYLTIDNKDKYKFIDNYFKYIYYDKCLYIIPNTYRKILSTLLDNNLNELVFTKDNIELFKKGMLRSIKNNINVSDNVKDIVISSKPEASIYFDLNKDYITCEIKLDYKGNIINYFDKLDNIIRNDEYENELITKINNLGFEIGKNKIMLTDIDDIGYFLSEGISTLSEYKVFTTKKIDSIKFIKESKVRSNFSIGMGGIMSYNFSAENINLDELDNVFESLKNKKKYYRLKNGNIIDLDNSELNELKDLVDDLNLSKSDIKNGNVEIPKYRAFYIDSLKSDYNIIDTDNKFNTFINNFRKYKQTNITFSSKDDKILRDYQKDGVKWLYTLYKCDLGGILADEMGLGKSLQTICMIKEVLKEKSTAKIMIVCPTALVYNWKKELDKFASDLKYVVVAESKDKRKEIIKDFDKYNIFITTYGLIRNDNDEYEDKFFDICIIDEAQAIKNYQAGMTKEIKKIKAKTKFALTGTPLENSVLELWSIFDFIMPGYLNGIKTFRELYGVSEVDDYSLKKLEKLNYQIKPFMLRRKKQDVLKSLPDKIENNIYLELPDMQKKLYLKVLKESEKEINELIETEGFRKARFKILQLLMKLRQVCIDPNIKYSNYTGESVKFEKLLEIVKNYISENHKILIFSSFKTVIDRVQTIFNKEHITSYMICGDVKSKERMNLVEKFNKDDTNCFLITLASGGTGLNLTSADVVIHLDIWWNPQVENQATDRAHRIGQEKKVTVIKLITKGTIEERIIELQNKKKILSDNLIEGHSSETISSLTENELRNLLSMGNE